MRETHRSIFRAEAVRRYLQSREESVLPRLVSPRVFFCLWLLLGLLATSGVVAWFTQVPIYVSGPAAVVDGSGRTPPIGDEIVVIAFLPPDHLSHLRTGQKIFLPLDRAGRRLGRTIIAVEPEIHSPHLAQRRFGLSAATAQAITQPAAVAIARLEPRPTDLPAATYVGSVYPAEVEIGSRRAVSLLPLIGQFFGE